MKENLGIVIQARMGSSRLPGKVLMDFCGKPMLLFQVEVLRKFTLCTKIVVATSTNPHDDAIEALCRQHRIAYVRGSEHDVFGRLCLAAQRFGFEQLVRLTGDNPLPHCAVLNTCLRTHLRFQPDLTSTREILHDRSLRRFLPKGSSVDIMNCRTLLSIERGALDAFQQEHVIPIFFEGGYRVKLVRTVEGFSAASMSLSIDDGRDFARVSRYVQDLIKRGRLWQTLGLLHGP